MDFCDTAEPGVDLVEAKVAAAQEIDGVLGSHSEG